jgi:hypothetical protein
MNYDDYDFLTQHKCCVCDKIENNKDMIWGRAKNTLQAHRDGWQMASNLPFHYVCSDACAEVLKKHFEELKANKAKQK